jgi:hypothetical protein
MSPLIYITSLAMVLGAVIVVFVIRYVSQVVQARLHAAQTQDYRKLASDSVTAQSGNAATLSAIQSELAEIKTRLASVEKILKEVG